MKRKSLVLVVLVTLLLSSCATLFGKKTHPLAISSSPKGAEVYVNGFKRGVTPIELKLKADRDYTIEFRKDGFENVTRVVNSKVSGGWIVLDILGGLIPIVIDAATGDWNKLDQDSVNADLEKSNK